MWLYYFLDILSTITESLSMLVVIECFCRTPRFPKNISRALVAVCHGAAVFYMTFCTDLGALKTFIGISWMVVLTQICYQASFHESLIITELTYVVMLILPESVTVPVMSLVTDGDIYNTINNVPVLKWELFVLCILLRLLFCVAVRYLLRNFQYRLQRKDAFVLTAGFLLTFGFSFASMYRYLNLHWTDTFVLDLIAAMLSTYFIVQFLYTKNVACLREQEQKDQIRIAQLNRQFEYYREKLKDEEKVRALYHDMKNHLLILQKQIDSPETKEMIETLKAQAAMYENYTHTGNDFLDIILKDKTEKAHEKKIDLSVSANLDGIDFIEPLDISTIFGNGLDNAIEASEKLPEDQRAILVKAGKRQNFFSVLVENNCLEERGDRKSKTAKQDDFLHGFGLSNMEKAVAKYGGELTVKCENGRFTLKILVPIP